MTPTVDICLRVKAALLLMLMTGRCSQGAYLWETSTPYIMTTWEIGINATNVAWKYLTEDGLPPLDCIERAISETCELNWCGNNVGPYDKIDEQGDLSLDAMMMDGDTKVVGGVGNLRNVRAAISVARSVMKYTTHTLITGEGATEFATEMGFPQEDLKTELTEYEHEKWINDSCQPNFRQNVVPDPSENCGPYEPVPDDAKGKDARLADAADHDTICQFIIDGDQAAVGVSTNGLKHKIPGRVGDSPIPGAGGYAWSGVGAAEATGNGDVMLRFLPSFESVLRMEDGWRPDYAVISTVTRMRDAFPGQGVAVLVGNVQGQFSAACAGYTSVEFVVRSHEIPTTLMEINCEESLEPPDDA